MRNIPLIWNLLIVFVFAAAGVLEARRLIARHPDLVLETVHKKTPYFYVILPIVLMLFGINKLFQYRPDLLWNLPLWLQYHYSRITWGSILALFAFLFSLAAALAYKTGHRQKRLLAAAGVIFILAIQATQWTQTRPIAPRLGHSVNPDGVVIQTSLVSCGAAAAANILKKFGIERTEKQMAELLGTGAISGTSAAQLVHGMRKLGIDGRLVAVPDKDPEKIHPPAVVYFGRIAAGAKFHSVVMMGWQDGKIEVWDSINGQALFEKPSFRDEWSGRGIEFRRKQG